MTTIDSANPLDDILRDLDAHEQPAATVVIESRRYGKAVTVIEGLDDRGDVQDLLKALKHGLATGGAIKDAASNSRATTAVLPSPS